MVDRSGLSRAAQGDASPIAELQQLFSAPYETLPERAACHDRLKPRSSSTPVECPTTAARLDVGSNAIRFFRLLALCLVLIAAAAVAEPVSTDEQEPRHLLVATVDNYLPCSDEVANNYEGLSIDVWRRAGTINRPYTLATISTFSQAVDAASYGIVDVVASCHKITPERLERVEFHPYTRDSLGMLSRENNPFDFGFAKRLMNDPVVSLSLITLLLISGLSALALAVLESNFQGMSGFSGNRSVRFTKAWIMLLLGTNR